MQWKTSTELVPYPEAVSFMEERVGGIYAGREDELVWFLEHPPLYTGGSSAKEGDLLEHGRFPVYYPGRGGEYTYHGPGQRIAYLMLDLKKHFAPSPPDLRGYIRMLEEWIIEVLAELGIEGTTREGRIGVWVQHPQKGECKIAAIGVRVRRWVSYHGIAFNVHPDLSHYAGIVPCGISDFGVTSLHDLGIEMPLSEVDKLLKKALKKKLVR